MSDLSQPRFVSDGQRTHEPPPYREWRAGMGKRPVIHELRLFYWSPLGHNGGETFFSVQSHAHDAISTIYISHHRRLSEAIEELRERMRWRRQGERVAVDVASLLTHHRQGSHMEWFYGLLKHSSKEDGDHNLYSMSPNDGLPFERS